MSYGRVALGKQTRCTGWQDRSALQNSVSQGKRRSIRGRTPRSNDLFAALKNTLFTALGQRDVGHTGLSPMSMAAPYSPPQVTYMTSGRGIKL
jgi:hypothetical protein